MSGGDHDVGLRFSRTHKLAWDAASARIFEAAGFAAVGTTSAGIAYTRGLQDGQRIWRQTMMHEITVIAGSVTGPVTADIEAGYAARPDGIAQTGREAIQARRRHQSGGQCAN